MAWIQYEQAGQFRMTLLSLEKKSLLIDLPLPEDRLVLHSGSQCCVVFRRFPRRDWPVAVGMAGWEPTSGKYRITEKASPIEQEGSELWRVQYEGEGTLLLNVLSGETFVAPAATAPAEYVATYYPESSYYPEIRTFLSEKFNCIEGPIEYSESEHGFATAFHQKESETLTTHTAFWNKQGALICDDRCLEKQKGISDALLCGNADWMLYLKTESEIVFTSWKQL